jgi:COP9 signalosome complex subunit 5
MQLIQDPAIAIVIDPKRTIAAGKVEIGCFRAFTNDYAEKNQLNKTSGAGLEMIKGDKLEEFGVHAHKYYKIEHSVFKSSIDCLVLERLWNEYWVHTLASSPLQNNADNIDKSVVNVVQKFQKIQSQHVLGLKKGNRPGEQQVVDQEAIEPITKEASKLAVDCCHGVMFE